MSERHTLLMPLVGPMQSWGYRSRFDDRDTGLEPTRSGIIGLLCAACRVPRSDTNRLQQLNDALRIGVRVDAPGRVMVDFHTAQNVLRANGGLQDTVVSNRFYLADARFMIGLESANLDCLRALEVGLRNPAWPLCLGRKSFPLALPPHLPDGQESLLLNTPLEAALQGAPWFRLKPGETPGANRKPPALLRMVLEADPTETPDFATSGRPVMTLGDRPLDFESRRFGLRSVIVDDINAPEIIEEGLCISRN